jgi:hypothetical protein
LQQGLDTYLDQFKFTKVQINMKKSTTLILLFTLWSMNSFASSNHTLNGTFGCVLSPNFSGFINRVTSGNGSSREANGLFLIKFITGSSTVSFSGVSNTINNFEQKDATVKTYIASNLTHFNYTPNNPVDNMYMWQDTSSSPPFVSYFIMVNSGKTLIGIDAPTVDKNSNIICQAL